MLPIGLLIVIEFAHNLDFVATSCFWRIQVDVSSCTVSEKKHVSVKVKRHFLKSNCGISSHNPSEPPTHCCHSKMPTSLKSESSHESSTPSSTHLCCLLVSKCVLLNIFGCPKKHSMHLMYFLNILIIQIGKSKKKLKQKCWICEEMLNIFLSSS